MKWKTRLELLYNNATCLSDAIELSSSFKSCAVGEVLGVNENIEDEYLRKVMALMRVTPLFNMGLSFHDDLSNVNIEEAILQHEKIHQWVKSNPKKMAEIKKEVRIAKQLQRRDKNEKNQQVL